MADQYRTAPFRRPSSSTLGGSGPARTPIAFIHAMLKTYKRNQMDPTQALQAACIWPEHLATTDARITARQMEAFSRVAMEQLDDEALGWYSRPLPWGTYGMLARASLTAPTLRVALKRWCRHHNLLTRDVEFSFEESSGLAKVLLKEHRALGDSRELCLLTNLRNLHGYASWLIDLYLPPSSVDFPLSPPLHADLYPSLFPGPVRFDSSECAFAFDSQYLDHPVRRDEQALQAMLRNGVRLIVLPYQPTSSVVQRVHELLRIRTREIRTAESLGRELHRSVRSLHRQIQMEGTSLQAIKDEVRRERAMALLTSTEKPVKQVAGAVGFDNETSFARAFRGWTGLSPREFRQKALVPAGSVSTLQPIG